MEPTPCGHLVGAAHAVALVAEGGEDSAAYIGSSHTLNILSTSRSLLLRDLNILSISRSLLFRALNILSIL
jgi:hypothetical protein